MHYYRDMKITQFNNPDLIHGVSLTPDTSPTMINRDYHIGVDKHPGVVYFICVDDEIYKVGGSGAHFKDLVSQYLLNLRKRAMPQFTRFPIYLMMLHLINQGHKVEFYYIRVPEYKVEVTDLTTGQPRMVRVNDFQAYESAYLKMVTEMDGSIPPWNKSESGGSFDPELRTLWENRDMRVKTNQSVLFDYDQFFQTKYNFLDS